VNRRPFSRIILLSLLFCIAASGAETAANLSAQLRQLSLDPDACYRVRDLSLQREDARVFLTDGYLIFSRAVGGRRVMALYSAAESGDDAEILLRPPDRSERSSLAAATGSPNLNEHFQSAIFIYTDRTADELLEAIQSGVPKPAPEMGLLLAGRMDEAIRNFAESFQVRLVLDLLTQDTSKGLFYAAFSGKTLGNFDLLYDPTVPEQFILGQISTKLAAHFDVWASFQSRARRQSRILPAQDALLEDYRIEATLRQDLVLDVTTRVTLKAQQRLSGALGFEMAPQMEITGVTLDGKEVEVFRRESMRANLIGGRSNDPFLVVLPEPLANGSAHELVFHHKGKVVRPAGNDVYFVAARTNWYPSRGLHFTTYDLTLKVPAALSVVATGDISEERVEGEWRIARRRTTAPVRVAGFNIGAYEGVKTTRGGFHLEVFANRKAEPALQPRAAGQLMVTPNWTAHTGRVRSSELIPIPAPPPPSSTARLDSLASEIGSALEWMAGLFGPPPLKSLTVSPIPGNFGQGFPGLLYLSTISFLNEKDRPVNYQTPYQNAFYSEILHAHETAHQWWGNLVTSATYRDDWLQEAFSNYSALLVLERKKGAKALETTLEEYRRELLMPVGETKGVTVEQAGPITWGLRLQNTATIDPWRVIIYNKGSWIMHMLRRRMGDDQFLAMLGAVRKRFAYQAISTEQFREIAAEFSPKGLPDPTLENFFDNWVYSTGMPSVEFTSTLHGKAPNYQLSLSVKQSGVSEEFSYDLPVEIRLPGQVRPMVKWIRTGPETSVVNVPLKAVPLKVELAPGSGLLTARK
jgi:hypothetical protein